MEIHSIGPFLDYWKSVRNRTKRVVACIPPDRMDWTYARGKFTFADLIRHLATIERFMYAETVQGKPSAYPGCGKDLADGYDQVVAFMDRMDAEAIEIFRQLSDENLTAKCVTPAGSAITIWKWLRAMVEHEVHHRGQIYIMLSMIGVETPPLYGLTSEEVQARSASR